MGRHQEEHATTEKASCAVESQRIAGLRYLARMIARAYLQKAESPNEASESEKKAE